MSSRKLFLILFPFFILPSFASGQCNKGWQWLHPFPTSDAIEDIHVVSSDTIYALPRAIPPTGAPVMKSTNGGDSWTPFKAVSDDLLNSLFFLDHERGWVCGNNGAVYRTMDGGKNWTDISVATSKNFRAIEFATVDSGIVVGNDGAIYYTSDGGNTWGSPSVNILGDLRDIDMINAQEAYVVEGYGGAQVFYTNTGGLFWDNRSFNTNDGLRAVDFISSDTGFVAGTNTTFRYTYNGGTTWMSKSFSGLYPSAFKDIQFTDPDTGYLAVNIGKLLKTVNGGNNWNTKWNGSNYADHFHFSDDDHGWLIASGFNLYKTSTGGSNWKKKDTGVSQGGGGEYFYSVDFTSPDSGWIVGDTDVGGGYSEGTVYRTVNGGKDWSHLFSTPSASVGGPRLTSVDFIDDDTGWAAGFEGHIIHTTDGGQNWSDQNTISSSDIWGLDFLDGDTGIAVGGSIFLTKDGGSYWADQIGVTSNKLFDVQMIDGDQAFIVGANGTMLRTSNGGLSWNSIPSGTSVDLVGLHFYNSDSGWAVGGKGMILFTEDGGLNWSQRQSNTQKKLTKVHFSDPDTGWCVGDSGTVVVTTDGGLNWKVFPTATDKNLSDIHVPSSIRGVAVGGSSSILGFKGFPFYANAGIKKNQLDTLTVAFSGKTANQKDHHWEFGDGTTSNQNDPTHTFPDTGSYEVCLTVTDSCGRIDSTCRNVILCYPLDAGFTDSVDGTTVYFQDTSVGADYWNWNFDDQGYGNQKNPSYNFSSKGVYDVCMIVGNRCNELDTTCRPVYVGVSGIENKEEEGLEIIATPNPFKHWTSLQYELSDRRSVLIKILDPEGRKVKEYGPVRRTSGSYRRKIDLDDEGPGIYYFHLEAGNISRTGKLIQIE